MADIWKKRTYTLLLILPEPFYSTCFTCYILSVCIFGEHMLAVPNFYTMCVTSRARTTDLSIASHRISGVMVSMLAFECDRSCVRVKPKIIKLVFVASPRSTRQQGVRSKTGWPRFRIMSEWGDMSTSGLLFQRATTIKTTVRVLAWHKADIIIISLNATDAEKLLIWLHSLPSGTSEFTPDFSGVYVSSILSFLCIALSTIVLYFLYFCRLFVIS